MQLKHLCRNYLSKTASLKSDRFLNTYVFEQNIYLIIQIHLSEAENQKRALNSFFLRFQNKLHKGNKNITSLLSTEKISIALLVTFSKCVSIFFNSEIKDSG